MREYWIARDTLDGLKVVQLDITKETDELAYVARGHREHVGYRTFVYKDNPSIHSTKIGALMWLKHRKEGFRDDLIKDAANMCRTIKALDRMIFLARDAQPDEVVIEETTDTGCGAQEER